MPTPSQVLNTSRRETIRLIALILLVASALTAVGAGLALLVVQIPTLAVLLLNGLVIMLATAITLGLHRHQLALQVLPVASAIVLVQISTALFLPEFRLVTAPFFAVVVLLVSMAGRRGLTVGALAVCALLAAIVVALDLRLAWATSLAPYTTPIQVVIVVSLIVTIWAITDRLTEAQAGAMRIAEQQAAAAEVARSEAEAARVEVERRVVEQQRLLELVQTLELPVISIDSGVLVAPLVGTLDSKRMDGLRREILVAVAERRAHTVILDVTGVIVIDTLVARALMDTAQAIKLLGARTLICGIRAVVAQTLVSLDIDLSDLNPAPNLGVALALVRAQPTGPAGAAATVAQPPV